MNALYCCLLSIANKDMHHHPLVHAACADVVHVGFTWSPQTDWNAMTFILYPKLFNRVSNMYMQLCCSQYGMDKNFSEA